MQQLLDKVKAQIDLFEKHKELSGENFNIFSIMSMENDEVFTHSAIIAELLNPKGSHSLGILPLQCFVKQNFEEGFEFNFDDVKSLKEVFAGKINEDKTEGGRLDIVVKNSAGQIFVIENKIYALEQKNQLLRYKNRYPLAKLFYLTLFGDDSKQQVGNENNETYTAISYQKNILNWLEDCVKLAYNKPMVREVLNQYIYLLKKLTKQSTNKEMKTEITDLIKKNLEASTEIHNNYESAIKEIQMEFLEDLKTEIEGQISIWDFIIQMDSDKKVYGIEMRQKNTDFHLVFRFNKFNEAALNIINYVTDKVNDKNAVQFLIADFKFKKSHFSSTNIYTLLETGITPFKLIDLEKNIRIKTYCESITNVLKSFKINN
jgi:hypothetical protein